MCFSNQRAGRVHTAQANATNNYLYQSQIQQGHLIMKVQVGNVNQSPRFDGRVVSCPILNLLLDHSYHRYLVLAFGVELDLT